MKIFFTLLLAIILFMPFSSFSGEMVLKGVYQGKNLYIINPLLDGNQDYCVFEVKINGKEYNDVINSSTFGIFLENLGFKYGQDFNIVIKHHDNCYPKLVNPEVLKPISTFQIVDFSLGSNNILTFTTENESAKLTFYVEEYRWGKWNEIKKVPGEGGPQSQVYSLKVYPFTGENKFRVYQIDEKYEKFYSNEMVFNLEREKIKIISNVNKVKKEIEFSEVTRYSIVDDYGAELISGHGKTIDTNELNKGSYFLNYDNEYVLIKKK